MKKILVLLGLVFVQSAFCADDNGIKELGKQVDASAEKVKEGAENIAEGKNPLNEKGVAEKSGEYIDEKASEVKDLAVDAKDSLLNKGPAEKAGEKVDEALESVTK